MHVNLLIVGLAKRYLKCKCTFREIYDGIKIYNCIYLSNYMYIYIFDLQFSILQWLTERMMCEPASRACDQSAAWHQMPVSAQAGLKT